MVGVHDQTPRVVALMWNLRILVNMNGHIYADELIVLIFYDIYN